MAQPTGASRSAAIGRHRASTCGWFACRGRALLSNADEAIWDWISEDVTANTCLGTKAQVREHVGTFLHGLRARAEDVKRRCRTVLQAQADGLAMTTTKLIQAPQDVEPTWALL